LPENGEPAKAKICKTKSERLPALGAPSVLLSVSGGGKCAHGKWSGINLSANRIHATRGANQVKNSCPANKR
jgi:hypothetical protein